MTNKRLPENMYILRQSRISGLLLAVFPEIDPNDVDRCRVIHESARDESGATLYTEYAEHLPSLWTITRDPREIDPTVLSGPERESLDAGVKQINPLAWYSQADYYDPPGIQYALMRNWIEGPCKGVLQTVQMHVSASGMTRHIAIIGASAEGLPVDMTWSIAKLMGWRLTDSRKTGYRAIITGGCGMDMGFALIYNLSYRLYRDGYKITHKWLL